LFATATLASASRWQTSGYQNGSEWGESIYKATARCHREETGGKLAPAMDDETAELMRLSVR
jgi:hypothetical protein